MKTWLKVLICLNLFLTSSWLLTFNWFSFLSPQGSLRQSYLSGKMDPLATAAVFDNQVFTLNDFLVRELAKEKLAAKEGADRVLGETSDKRIEVDLTNQRLYAFEGSNKIYDFAISSGKWGRTPAGTFRVWIKLRYAKMEGGSTALRTYYYLPNVPYVMYFYNDEIPKWRGYGIHGAYWHNNFGHPMSHGCINMKIEEAGLLYYWAKPELNGKQSIYASDDNPGTPIVIYGKAPQT